MAIETIQGIGDLARIDRGTVDLLFREALHATIEDMIDRPGVEAAREIQIKVRLAPVAGDAGHLEDVHAQIEVKATRPTLKTRVYSMTPQGEGLAYNDLSAGNPRQHTLDELEHGKDD